MKPYLFSPLSIRQRITVLTCALLLSVIVVFGLISSIGVRKAALKVGHERLQTLTEQLGTMLSGNTKTLVSTTYAAFNKPVIKAYLLSDGQDSSAEAIKYLNELRKDTTNVLVELKNSRLENVYRYALDGINITANLDSNLINLNKHSKPDSGRVGKFYAFDSSVYYPTVVAVIDNNKLAGFAIRWKKLTTTKKSLEQLTELLGTDARLFLGNDDRKLWTDMRVTVPSPQLADQTSGIIEYSRDNKKVLSYASPVANSNWMVAVELSKKKLLEAANRFLYWLIIAGSIILIIGMSIAWIASRRLSEPLRNLTMAASTIASGNLSKSVQLNRRDELGKLARAFNAMEIQVQKSRKALEEKAEKYKLLFENNPIPMWIISRDTFNVLDVNKSAVKHYGYSREEFLKLNAIDLRPAEDIDKYLTWTRTRNEKSDYAGVWRHKKKDGSVIMVDIIAQDILYQEQQARLVLSNDVTEKLKAEAELMKYRIDQQRIITETAIQVQEKEREEIGKELHDNINQILAAARMQLEMGMKSNENKDLFIKSNQNINLAIKEIRQISQTLVAPSLANTSLTEAIKEIIQNMNSASSVKVEFNETNYDEGRIDENLKLMFYRIVQEQINNILKHSKASHVNIELSSTPENTVLIIHDDGIGFEPSKTKGGIGLRNISNRAKFYGGVSEINSSPGSGSTLTVTIPLNQDVVALKNE